VLPWRNKRLEMWVTPTRTTLSLQGSGRADVLAKVERGSDEDVASHFALCLQAVPVQRCTLQIVLDDSLARFWKVEPPVNTAHFEDLCAAARIRFEALYDLPISEWEIQGDWNATEAFLACAVPVNILAALSECLNVPKHRRTKVIGCTPAFVHSWNQHQPQMANKIDGIGVVNEKTVTIAIKQNAKWSEVRSMPLMEVGKESLQSVDQAIQNLSLQLDLKIPDAVWLTGKIPRQWMGCKTERIHWRRLVGEGAA